MRKQTNPSSQDFLHSASPPKQSRFQQHIRIDTRRKQNELKSHASPRRCLSLSNLKIIYFDNHKSAHVGIKLDLSPPRENVLRILRSEKRNSLGFWLPLPSSARFQQWWIFFHYVAHKKRFLLEKFVVVIVVVVMKTRCTMILAEKKYFRKLSFATLFYIHGENCKQVGAQIVKHKVIFHRLNETKARTNGWKFSGARWRLNYAKKRRRIEVDDDDTEGATRKRR